ncbi:MAG: hypothetical protein IKP86_08760 [Anaerolineaceae bacterium]|nr:hypothetical protein [Anaerolineaceae bacterium]
MDFYSRNYNNKQTGLWIAAAAVCAAAGAGLLFISMSQGIGVGGDATIYITSAKNLLAGKGLGLINAAGEFRLIPYFPPFYPLLLAFFGLFTSNLTLIALICNLVLFAGLIYLVTIWTMRVSESLFPGLLLGMLAAGSPMFIPAYSWAMSEPLAVFLGFAGLIVLEKGLIENSRFGFWASAVLTGLSFLTRYSSAAFIGAAVLLIICIEGESFKDRLISAFSYGIVSAVPMIVWLAIDFLQTHTVASRSIVSGRTGELWAAFLPKIKHVFTLWLLPDSLTVNMPGFLVTGIALFIVIFTAGCLAGSVMALRGGTHLPRYARMFFLLSVFDLLYFLLIIYVSLNTYPPITINTRMLLPVYLANFWLIYLLFALFEEYNHRLVRTFIFNCALFLFTALCCYRGIRIANQNAVDGLGYNSVSWKNSETVEWIRNNIPAEKTIVTNEETALLYLLDRTSWPMHEVYVNEPDKEYYAYESDTAAENDGSRRAFRQGGAFLVVFDTFEDQMADIYGENTPERIRKLFENLNVVFDGDDGTVYTLEDAG